MSFVYTYSQLVDHCVTYANTPHNTISCDPAKKLVVILNAKCHEVTLMMKFLTITVTLLTPQNSVSDYYACDTKYHDRCSHVRWLPLMTPKHQHYLHTASGSPNNVSR